MTAKIYYTNDDLEIIDYITDAGYKHDDNNTHRVFTFFYNEAFHLVLFFATPGDKGFIMFRVDDIRNNLPELKNIKLVLFDFLKSGNNEDILKDAILQVETIEMAGLGAELFK